MAADRPTAFWLGLLKQRRERMYEETLDLSTPIVWECEEERQAAIAFFNAAFRAEESGLRQAHEIADEIGAWDPELAETLRLYGDEEGWHRELLTQFIAWLGGEVRPMGRVTRSFYTLYARAKRPETIVVVNLMFETIGAATYRLALRSAKPHPAIRQMLTILTRDESFHVPLNAHFLRRVLAHEQPSRLGRLRLRAIYQTLSFALTGLAAASRETAAAFDHISFQMLARAYTEHLGRLFVYAHDLGFAPSRFLLSCFGLSRDALAGHDDVLSPEAAERAADRSRVVVDAP